MALHFFKNWSTWWTKLGVKGRFAPVLLLIAYWNGLQAVGGLKGDLVFCSSVAVVLYYLGPSFRRVYGFLLPLLLTAILYDSQRYFADLIRGPIHVVEPYEFDKFFFGIKTSTGVLTPNEWWQLHTYPFLDLISGAAYIVFIPVYLSVAGYFVFWLSRRGTKRVSADSIRIHSPQIMWAFLWVNLIGWSTYYWYAASPPWYVSLYGFGPARTDIPANLAGCARFDALLGIPVFLNWYGHSADVHGAIPSLHIAYPLMSVYYAFRFGALRVTTTVFFILMCFSAVYLNHHYILDILWGASYAMGVALGFDLLWNRKLKKSHQLLADLKTFPKASL